MAKKEARDPGLPDGYPVEVTRTQFGLIVGMNLTNVNKFATMKVLVPGKQKSRLDLHASLRAYVQHLRDQAAGRAVGNNGATLAASRSRLADLQAEEVSLRLARARGEFVSLDDVAEGWNKIAQIVRSEALALPSKIGFTVPHLTPHDRLSVADLCREMLESIAEEAKSARVPGSVQGKEFVREKMTARPVPKPVKLPSSRGRPRGT